jgi:hypothetical protein
MMGSDAKGKGEILPSQEGKTMRGSADESFIAGFA